MPLSHSLTYLLTHSHHRYRANTLNCSLPSSLALHNTTPLDSSTLYCSLATLSRSYITSETVLHSLTHSLTHSHTLHDSNKVSHTQTGPPPPGLILVLRPYTPSSVTALKQTAAGQRAVMLHSAPEKQKKIQKNFLKNRKNANTYFFALSGCGGLRHHPTHSLTHSFTCPIAIPTPISSFFFSTLLLHYTTQHYTTRAS